MENKLKRNDLIYKTGRDVLIVYKKKQIIFIKTLQKILKQSLIIQIMN